MGSRREGDEVPWPVGFATRGARTRTHQYVEHPEASKHRWVRCIVVRSRDLMNHAGEHARPAVMPMCWNGERNYGLALIPRL